MRMHACQEGIKEGELRVLYAGTCRKYYCYINTPALAHLGRVVPSLGRHSRANLY